MFSLKKKKKAGSLSTLFFQSAELLKKENGLLPLIGFKFVYFLIDES